MDSEGLMLLTDDGTLQARISQPRHKTRKVYWVQVEGRPDAAAFESARSTLLEGVHLKDGLARAVAVRRRESPPLTARQPPVTAHRAARSSWLEVDLESGRNRQVRRMLAAVGLPVLRLLRYQIGPVTLDGLSPGEWETLPPRISDRILWSSTPSRVRDLPR
jgi:23S rRNA pseudouridine2457 synthase